MAARRCPLASCIVAAVAAIALVAVAPPAAGYPGAPWFEPSKPYTQNFPDPSVVLDGATYHAYGTATGGAYLPVMSSRDTGTWVARPAYQQPTCVGGSSDPFFNDALPCPASWAPDRPVGGRLKKEVWAPGVAEIGGRWVVFYAIRQHLDRDRFCISVATADGPLGPFVDTTTGPLVCDADPNGSIDPQPFVDVDGSAWLLWKSEGIPGVAPTRLWSRRLAAAGTTFAPGSAPVELLRTSQGWEGDVIENPAMVRHQGRLLLFYSGNEHRSGDYAVGWATCASVGGPCTKSAANPVLASRGDRLGPGGPAPFVDAAGELRLAYHHWNAPHTSYPAFPDCEQQGTCTTQGQRRMAVDHVQVTADGVQVGGQAPVRPVVQPLDPACPAGRVPPSGFGDVPAASPHARAVDCVAWWHLTGGTSPGRYSPTTSVTRAQMATFVARALRASSAGLPPGRAGQFRDVPPGAPHADDIDALASAAVLSGRSDGTYDPGGVVTREQMATFLARAFKRASGSALPIGRSWFPDDDGSAHEASIDKIASAGLGGGRPDGTYGPRAPVARDQMASFLARTLALLVERGHASPPA